MKLVNNDPFVSPLTNVSQLAIINRVRDFIQESRIKEAVLFETFFGFIVTFSYKDHLYSGQHRAARLDHTDLVFWNDISTKLRWFEIGTSEISIAFDR